MGMWRIQLLWLYSWICAPCNDINLYNIRCHMIFMCHVMNKLTISAVS